MKKLNLTKEFLVKEYIVNKKSTVQIAKEFGCDNSTIGRALKRNNIETRNVLESHYNCADILTKKFLIKEYIKNKKSCNQIAKETGLSCETIRVYLIKYKISRRIGDFQRGKYHIGYKGSKALQKQKYYCKHCPNQVSYCGSLYGTGICSECARINCSSETRKKLSIASKRNWQNKEYRDKTRKAILKANNISPNKPEKSLIKLLNKLFPKTYKFVGDGKLMIDKFCPDFVNKADNKIIEFYGDYWHNLPDRKALDIVRLKTYKKLGYKTLIIWEKELKDLNKVTNKIKEFNNASL